MVSKTIVIARTNTCVPVVTEPSLFLFIFVASENLVGRIETDLDVGTRIVAFVFDGTGSDSVQRRRCQEIVVARLPLALTIPSKDSLGGSSVRVLLLLLLKALAVVVLRRRNRGYLVRFFHKRTVVVEC